MTLEEGVRDLVMRHADFLNLGREEDFAENFTPEGVWEVVGYSKAEGRDQISATVHELRSRFEWVFQGVQGTRIISSGSDTARARSYIVEYGKLRENSYFLFASYHDDCVLVDGKWYFKHRTADPLYLGDAGLNAPIRSFPALDHFAQG